MNRIRRALLAALALSLSLSGILQAAEEGRILGTVVDEAGAPIAGAKAVLTRAETSYKLEKTTDKKGQFVLLVLDATHEYQLRVEKEGYLPMEGPVKPKIQDTLRLTFTLAKPAPAPVEDPAAKALEGNAQAVLAYNEGVEILKKGDNAAALAKFEAASSLDPKLPEAHAVIAELSLELGEHAKALAAADRYLEIRPGDVRGLQARYDALKAMGDKEKAQGALQALAAADRSLDTAVRLYNEGAEATRTGDLDQAAVWFGYALAVAPEDPRFIKGHYVVGLTYAKSEKAEDKAKAREHLETFLRLAPNDPDAGSAKEMLEYLKQ
jgi:tetratricopeptide (TPR) repeat protein